MILTKKITLAFSALAAVSAMNAAPAPSGPSGLLGTQYTELSLGLSDVRHISNNLYDGGIGANTSLVPGLLDGGATYNYSWIGGANKGHANTIGGYVNAYTVLNGVKPFAGVGLGYQWTSFKFVGSDDQALWNASVGVEIPAGVVTITPRIIYNDDFEGSANSGQSWTYQVEGNYWVNPKTAVFASIGKTDVNHSRFDQWNYRIGLRARF
jgi:hypothetical protein